MLVVLDLETTGLNTNADDILEVGAIVLDDNDQPVARFESLVRRWKQMEDIDPFVVNMHHKSGLWPALGSAEAVLRTIRVVDWQLHDWLQSHGAKPRGITLVGNSIHFDRSFITAQMPALNGLLAHRMVDLSTLQYPLERWGVLPPLDGKVPHRALPDCEQELAHFHRVKQHLLDLHTFKEAHGGAEQRY